MKLNNMRTLQLRRSISRSPLRFAFLLIPLALAIFTSPVDAASPSKTHEINFDKLVPCVGEIVHLKGPIRVSLTFAGKNLAEAKVFVEGIRGKGENSGRTYSADPNNKEESQKYNVPRKGPGRGELIVKFLVIGRRQGNDNIRFWAKQVVGLKFDGKTLDVDWDPLKVCVMP